jgi:hypothetical protein
MRTLLAAALCLLAAGCMSSGGTSSEPRLTKAEYLKQADAICAKYDAELEALPQPDTLEALARMAETAKPIAANGVQQLRALQPPEELADEVDAWLDRNDANVDAIERLHDAAAAGDETGVQKVAAEAADNEQQADLMAAALGLTDCATSS